MGLIPMLLDAMRQRKYANEFLRLQQHEEQKREMEKKKAKEEREASQSLDLPPSPYESLLKGLK